MPARSSTYALACQAISPGVNRPGDNRPQCSTAFSKSLTAISVPTPRSKTMPSLSPNFTGQEPCQPEKIFCWGLLSPGGSQSVRGQENIITICTVTLRNHYTKTPFPASELGLPPMKVKLRGHKNIIITTAYTIYSSVHRDYRR